MQIYEMVRNEDVSGVSGTGVVAEVVEFENGKVVVAWRLRDGGPKVANVIVYDSIEDAHTIHSHGQATKLVQRDN